jgi:hypothetical protein
MAKNNSSTHTFWELIESYKIIIPPLQRDYAQGREKNAEIEQIRNSLIDEIYESLVTNKLLVLNFIYGEKADSRFVPIDGQQRLTTLFLLHWYVFKQSSFSEGLEKLKGFSYQTRVTSERFCENICNATIDFSVDKISAEIKECYWLTGNFLKDPTIKSMLTVLDAIHLKFKTCTGFEELKDKLIGSECPISFLWLPMDNFQKTNDLYIKMNARGKLLSDFEIFKAKLQNSELIKDILGQGATNQEIILYISKYNNQYAEFFYRLFQCAYDEAMLTFIKEMVRDSYLSYVSRCGVSQKDYRDEYQRIRSMNGSIFFRYIEGGGKGFALCSDPTTAIVNGIHNATTLIEMLDAMPDTLVFENTLSKEYYDEKLLFIKNYQSDTLSDDVIRFATYSYLIKFGIPKDYESKNAYCMWKRFVFNVVTNSPFKSRREDVCEAFVFFAKLVDAIINADEAAVLKAISMITESNMTAAIRVQVKEEVVKAHLMTNVDWKKLILDAESYFEDGQIGFVLDCCKAGTNDWNIQMFEKYLELYKMFFDHEKKLSSVLSEQLFERALLCMPDSSGNHTAHLLKQPNSTTSWGFIGKNYKDFLSNKNDEKKRQILKRLIDRLDGAVDYSKVLTDIIASIDESNFKHADAWKLPFIKEDMFDVMMGYYKFKNCINLSDNRKEVLMIAGTTVRAYSMELYTYLLYRELVRQKVKNVKTVLYTTAVMNNHEGFPLRYLETGNAEIGYSYAAEDSAHPYILKTDAGIQKMTFAEAVAAVKA